MYTKQKLEKYWAENIINHTQRNKNNQIFIRLISPGTSIHGLHKGAIHSDIVNQPYAAYRTILLHGPDSKNPFTEKKIN